MSREVEQNKNNLVSTYPLYMEEKRSVKKGFYRNKLMLCVYNEYIIILRNIYAAIKTRELENFQHF